MSPEKGPRIQLEVGPTMPRGGEGDSRRVQTGWGPLEPREPAMPEAHMGQRDPARNPCHEELQAKGTGALPKILGGSRPGGP